MKTPIKPVVGDQPGRAWKVLRFDAPPREQGLTLLELLIVIAILALLAGLLLPVLARSKAHGYAIMCGNSSRQLALAWTMYTDDNNANLPYNVAPQANTMSGANLTDPNWVNNVMTWELTPGNTNLDFVNQSIIGFYISHNTSVYHCPSDHVVSDVQKAAGWTTRVRSFAMNAMVGNAGNAVVNGANIYNPGYQQFLKESDFHDPSSIFVFVEEHPDSIVDGYFWNNASQLAWEHLPASYHNNGGTFSFADGHTEIHRWQCASTLVPQIPAAINFPLTINADDAADFNWVMKHTSVPQN